MQTDGVDQQNTAVTPKDGLESALPNLASQSHLLHPNTGSNESDAITHLHYTATMTGWQLVEVVPHLSPAVSWDRLQHPCNPEPNKWFKKMMEACSGLHCNLSSQTRRIKMIPSAAGTPVRKDNIIGCVIRDEL